MRNKLITFTIPFYENETLLKKAVDSVLAQTISEWCLIISLDSPLSIQFINYIERLNDARIFVIENEKPGICSNWNNCIDATKSEFITILHSDDELAPDYISTMNELLTETPGNALYFCEAQVIDVNSQVVFSFVDRVKSLIRPKSDSIKLVGDEGLASLLKGCFIFCPSICYNLSILKKYKFRKKWQMVLDLDLYARLLIDGHSLYGTKKEVYRYRRHDNNQTAKLTKDFKRFDEEILLYSDLSNKAKKLKWKSTERIADKKVIIKLHLLFLMTKSIFLFNWKRTYSIFNYFTQVFGK